MSIKRVNIGIFGRTNSGKSSLMNLITQQEFSIVDEKPGTTADVKTTVMEIHDFSPIKLFDTAGIDEQGKLGEKKKQKSIDALKRSDIVLLVINPLNSDYQKNNFKIENEIINISKKRKKELFIIYNIFENHKNECINNIKNIQNHINNDNNIKTINLDLSNKKNYSIITNFIKKNSKLLEKQVPLLENIIPDKTVFLNIPMDEETPTKRLLRPQAMVQEFLIRKFVPTFAYRMDLTKARSNDKNISNQEKQRFLRHINMLIKDNNLQLLITDSQAMDIIAKWTKNLDIKITTFSIIMINYTSNGKLKNFVDGIQAFINLKRGDKILIAEGCNHDRKNEDIGTVQIPKKVEQLFGKDAIKIDHYFGRIFPEDKMLKEYKLVIHCGGCMLDGQTVRARLDDLIESGVPVTNYGVILSYFEGIDSLKNVIKPFNINI